MRSSVAGNSLWCTVYASGTGGERALELANNAWRDMLLGNDPPQAGPLDHLRDCVEGMEEDREESARTHRDASLPAPLLTFVVVQALPRGYAAGKDSFNKSH